MTKFVEAFAGKLGESWLGATLTPAFVFWAGGLGAWLWANRRLHGLDRIQTWFTGLDDPIRWALLVGVLIVVSASAVIAQRLSFGVLRLLEGYWPRILDSIRTRLITAREHSLERVEKKIQALQARDDLSPNELQELARLETVFARAPADPALRMPTKLGNIIRAGEGRPSERYGLDAVVCWHRLWLLLPQEAKTELQNARTRLDADVVALMWGVLFLAWAPLTLWSVPIACLTSAFSYRGAQASATIYSDLLEASFDLYRTDLYHALSWPLPDNPADELKIGKQVTEYLWRGSNEDTPKFVR